MSQKDLETAINRLQQARETISWARAALNDQASHLGDYNLTPDEKATLLQVMHAHLTEIYTTGAFSHPAIPIPPIDSDNEEVAPPIPPWPDQDDT